MEYWAGTTGENPSAPAWAIQERTTGQAVSLPPVLMISPHSGPALLQSHWSGKQPKSYPEEITALLVKRSHEIFSPDQVQPLIKDSYKGKL